MTTMFSRIEGFSQNAMRPVSSSAPERLSLAISGTARPTSHAHTPSAATPTMIGAHVVGRNSHRNRRVAIDPPTATAATGIRPAGPL
jgi:hypothetical protein